MERAIRRKRIHQALGDYDLYVMLLPALASLAIFKYVPMYVKDLVAICNTFNLGVAMHSGVEFGVELAAMLHTAATIPQMTFAGDAHYHYLTDYIIAGGKFRYENGAIRVPEGPGLGVALDEVKMARYEKLYEEKGDYFARFQPDPRRPGWVPAIGAW